MGRRLEGKAAIITGATSGMGRATAILFAREGAMLALAGRRENLGKEVVDKIESNGGKAVFIKTDVMDRNDIKNLVKTTIDIYKKVDILVNNAGIVRMFNFTEMDEAKDFDEVFNTNVKSYFLLCKEVLPYMIEKKKGAIINVGSVAGEVGVPKLTSYSASKGAIRQFTKSLAIEYARFGIRVNAVIPGATRTDMVPEGEDFEKFVLAHQPMGRVASPEEIAPAILFLASDEASFCTGSLLIIDGGETSI